MKDKKTASARLDSLFTTIQPDAAPSPKPKKQPSSTRATAPKKSSSTAESSAPPDRRSGGRVRRYKERITPLTLSVAPEHVRYIDGLCNAITINSGAPCSRGEVLRAIIDALTATAVDLTRASGGDEIRSILTARLRNKA